MHFVQAAPYCPPNQDLVCDEKPGQGHWVITPNVRRVSNAASICHPDDLLLRHTNDQKALRRSLENCLNSPRGIQRP